MSDKKTNTEHDDIQISTAFTYETGGNDFCDCVFCVAFRMRSKILISSTYKHSQFLPNVSREVTPKVTRAGIASGFIQNDIHDITTISADGM